MDARRIKQGRRFENEGNTNIQQTKLKQNQENMQLIVSNEKQSKISNDR